MTSSVPFHLSQFDTLGALASTTDSLDGFLIVGPKRRRAEERHSSQKEHRLDWLAVNGTSRQFRTCGKEAFFSSKIFIVTPRCLQHLQDCSSGFLSAPVKALLLKKARHVIAPLSDAGLVVQLNRLTAYHAFTALHRISIHPYVRRYSELPFLALGHAAYDDAFKQIRLCIEMGSNPQPRTLKFSPPP